MATFEMGDITPTIESGDKIFLVNGRIVLDETEFKEWIGKMERNMVEVELCQN